MAPNVGCDGRLGNGHMAGRNADAPEIACGGGRRAGLASSGCVC